MIRRTAPASLLVAAAALATLGVTCGPGGPSPSSDTCDAPALTGTVTEVDLGRFDGETFVAMAPDDVVPLVYGGQGFPMLVVNLRLRGADLPGCVPQVTRARNAAGEIEGSEALPLRARQVLPDTWITGDALLIVFGLYDGQRARLEAEVGGVTASVDVWVGAVGAPDAGVPDAEPLPDAAPPPDATPRPDGGGT